jgi:hypothetical protein
MSPAEQRARRATEFVDGSHMRGRNPLPDVEGRSHLQQPVAVDGSAHGPTARLPRVGEHTAEMSREAGIVGDIAGQSVAESDRVILTRQY